MSMGPPAETEAEERGYPTVAQSREEDVRTATEAWDLGKRLGFPLIQPGLQYHDPDRWIGEANN
ncbi:hypothetical protein [Mycobacteroides chelonae]|nr:hypothetical protein [Mycobacteroides chelonae]